MEEQAYTTSARVNAWHTAKPLLDAMVVEFRELSKKKPDGGASVHKVKIVNRLLGRCREALEGEPTLEFLDLLSEDDVPQNSDVIIMLSQYAASMDAFKKRYYKYDRYASEYRWIVKDPDDLEFDDTDDEDATEDESDEE
jgi:hypothetical protein